MNHGLVFTLCLYSFINFNILQIHDFLTGTTRKEQHSPKQE